MNKYNVGQRVPREGKTPLLIFECSEGGRYAAHTLCSPISKDCLSHLGRQPKPGEIIRLRSSKEVLFVGPCPSRSGRCDIAYNDRIELTEAEIDDAHAGRHARKVYDSVATRYERGGNGPGIRWLPRRTEPKGI